MLVRASKGSIIYAILIKEYKLAPGMAASHSTRCTNYYWQTPCEHTHSEGEWRLHSVFTNPSAARGARTRLTNKGHTVVIRHGDALTMELWTEDRDVQMTEAERVMLAAGSKMSELERAPATEPKKRRKKNVGA